MNRYQPARIVVEASVAEAPLTGRILKRLAGTPFDVVETVSAEIGRIAEAVDPIAAGKGVLAISRFHGPFLKKCPGTQGFVCCNYAVINTVTGCPLDCSYCILQAYLETKEPVYFTNFEDLEKELLEISRTQRYLRIGTGELTDSLALDPQTNFSQKILSIFEKFPGIVFEFKTKSTHAFSFHILPALALRTIIDAFRIIIA